MSYFTNPEYAIEEAEYLANLHKAPFAVVDSGDFAYFVMDAKTAKESLTNILEVVNPSDEGEDV